MPITSPSDSSLREPRLHRSRLLITACLFVAAFVALRYTGLGSLFNPGALAQQMRDSGAIGIAIYLVTFSIGELMAVPATVFFAAAVGVYGIFIGAALASLGSVIACTFSFAVVRVAGDWIAEKRSPGIFARYAPYVESRPIPTITVLRLLYGASPPVNWVLALARISTREFLIGTFAGLVPNALVYAWLIHQIAFEDQPELPRWGLGLIFVAIVAISVFAHRTMMRRLGDDVAASR